MTKKLIISECGINSNGNLANAFNQIYNSKWAGADIAKFQYYDPDKVLGKDNPLTSYAKACQFTKEEHNQLKTYCDKVDIEYLVSVFDAKDIKWADSLCKRHKVASRMSADEEFIKTLLSTKKQVIVSLQPKQAFNFISQLDFMVCIPNYPSSVEEMGPAIDYMKYIGSITKSKIGLSSHCPYAAPTLSAIANGGSIVENHTTYDRKLPGCDQSSSLEYGEYKDMVKVIRDMEKMSA